MRTDAIEDIRANMRKYGTGRTAVYAKRFQPYVMSAHGITVHKTGAVRIDFRLSGSTDMLAYFECGGSYGTTSSPVFYDTDVVPHTKRCAKCFRL